MGSREPLKVIDLRERKVCVLAINYWPVRPGQGTRHPKTICDILGSRFPTTVVTRKIQPRGGSFQVEQKGNTKVIRIPFVEFSRPGLFWRWLSNISFAMSCLLAFPYLDRKTVIFTVGPDPTYFVLSGPLLRFLTSSKLIALLTDPLPDVFFAMRPVTRPLRDLITSVCIKSYKSPDQMVVITEALKRRLVEYGVPAEKIAVVQLAVDVEKFSPTPSEILDSGHAGVRNEFLVVYSGSLGEMYDFDVMLEAAKIVEAKKERIRFLIRGMGAQEDHIRRRLDELQLSNVDLLPPLKESAEVIAFFNAASAFLVGIKDFQGIGLTQPSKIIEYWSCGKPVICTGLPGLKDFLQESEAAIVVPPRNPQGIADAVMALYQDPQLVTQMGMKGRAFAVRNFSTDVVATKLLDVIYKVGTP